MGRGPETSPWAKPEDQARGSGPWASPCPWARSISTALKLVRGLARPMVYSMGQALDPCPWPVPKLTPVEKLASTTAPSHKGLKFRNQLNNQLNCFSTNYKKECNKNFE